MRVRDAARAVAAVDAEVQGELGGRRELAVDVPAVEVDHRDLLGLEVGEVRAGRRDGDEVALTLADVARRPDHEPGRGEPAGGVGDVLALWLQRAHADIVPARAFRPGIDALEG